MSTHNIGCKYTLKARMNQVTLASMMVYVSNMTATCNCKSQVDYCNVS